MMNLGSILKMMGVKVAPEHVAKAEEIIPQLPGLINRIVQTFNSTIKNFDDRLARIEAALLRIENGNNGSDDTRPAGVGATQRVIERNGTGSDNGAD